MTTNTSPIIAKVCKHASYSVSKTHKSDLTSVKITNIHEDGSRSNSFIAIKDYKQPYWVVKDGKRNFKQHKDYIEAGMCREYRAPRCQIPFAVKKQLFGVADHKATITDVAGNQFVFGLDQTPPVHIKHQFFKKYGEWQDKEPYTMAAYDVEGDMFKPSIGDTKPVTMASVTFKDRAYFAGLRSWYQEREDVLARENKVEPRKMTDEVILAELKAAEGQYLKGHLERRNCTVQYELFDTRGEVVQACINKWHEWEPDWVTSWNATYDMESNQYSLEGDGFNLADVYCDESIPPDYRYYRLDKGRTHKTKEDGSSSPLEPQEKFPSIRTMAKWQWVDAMSFFAIKRAPVTGKLQDYSLEGIAKFVDVPGKLYTEEGKHLLPGTPQWHRHMQKYHPYLYSMYNIADNFVIEEINEKEHDFTLGLPMLLKYSEYFNYVSQPKTISDTLSFMARDLGFVWGSTPRNRDKAFTDRLPTLSNWIALLDTEKNASVGKALFEGLADVISSGRTDSSDIDVEGAYPHATLALNVSNRTTQIEVYHIQGADSEKFREIGVNYASSAEANAMGLCQALFRFPEADKLVETFERVMIEQGKGELLEQIKKGTKPRKPRINVEVEEDVKQAA